MRGSRWWDDNAHGWGGDDEVARGASRSRRVQLTRACRREAVSILTAQLLSSCDAGWADAVCRLPTRPPVQSFACECHESPTNPRSLPVAVDPNQPFSDQSSFPSSRPSATSRVDRHSRGNIDSMGHRQRDFYPVQIALVIIIFHASPSTKIVCYEL